MSVAFLGPRGTNSEEAALQYAGPDAEMIGFQSIPALTEAVETGLADVAVLPIENSIEGAISTTLDLLIHETRLMIRAEVVVPIRHMLVTAEGVRLQDIRRVVSHPQALGQSRVFLERCLPDAERVAALSTAGAVRETVEGNDRGQAAIGPERAQQLYGGAVLARDIQDSATNLTRFVVLGAEDAEPTGDDKTSFGLTTHADEPGTLARILAPVAEAGVQMTRLESRPTRGWLGTYVFLIDVLGHRTEPPLAGVLAMIEGSATSLRVFGSYPRFPIESLRERMQSPGMVPLDEGSSS